MKLPLSKDEWECYNDTPSFVIDDVNGEFEYILASADSPVDAQKRIYKMLEMYSNYGFRDTECEHVATDVINKHFVDTNDINRWSYYETA